MSESVYTAQDRANEGCCWTYYRDHCPGGGCLCDCHATNEEILLSDRARLRREVDRERQAFAELTTASVSRIEQLTARAEAAEQQAARLTAALDPERIAGDIASSLGDVDYQPNQCAQEHPDGMCVNVNDLMATIENYIRAALVAAREREQRLVDELMTPMTDDEDGSAECLSDCEDGDCMDTDTHYGFICLFRGCAGPVLNATDSRHASDCPVLMSAFAAAAPSAVAQEPRGEGV